MDLLKEMFRRNLSWTDTTYTAGLVAVEKSQWNHCCEMLESWAGRVGTAPLAAGIRCCCTGQAWSHALELLRALRACTSLANANVILPEFVAAIAACVDAGAFQVSRSQIERSRRYFLAYLHHFQCSKVPKDHWDCHQMISKDIVDITDNLFFAGRSDIYNLYCWPTHAGTIKGIIIMVNKFSYIAMK